jgi:hypothetical protein
MRKRFIDFINRMKIVFIKEKSCKAPTVWGWLVIVVIVVVSCALVVVNLNSFLSISKPIDAKVMVVEGWLPTYVLVMAAHEFKSKNYSMLFSTGTAIDKGDFFWEEKTFADMGAKAMRRIGLDSTIVFTVPASQVKVDRTFASACALKHWIDSCGVRIPKINVVSLGPHSRRSGLLFQKAFGNKTKVGMISYPDQTYDARTWWNSSNGFKTTIDEAVSYCYTKLVFWIKKRD